MPTPINRLQPCTRAYSASYIYEREPIFPSGFVDGFVFGAVVELAVVVVGAAPNR